MIKKLNALKNQKGMTLVELLAVMVIIGIIAAISIPAIGGLIENSRKDAAVSTATSLVEAARMYVAAEGVNDTEIILTATDSNTGIDLVKLGYLETTPKNPRTKLAYDIAEVVVTFEDNKAVYTVTLQTTANGKYNINGKKLEELKREFVGIS